MKTIAVVALAAAGAFSALADSEPVLALFPYTIVGRAVDAEGKAFEAKSGVSMKVLSAEGSVLAQTKVYTPGTESAWNFKLSVPVASAHVSGYAAKGDVLTLSVYKDGKTYEGLLKGDDARIGEAGASVAIRVLLADDDNGNGIADTYEKAKYNWMRKYKITGDFDPNADYDGDGQSNYAEYLAGTDPFDKSDRFGVDTMECEKDFDDRYIRIAFETNPGRTYSLREAAKLDGAGSVWERGDFRTAPSEESKAARLVNSRSEWKLQTIYLLKQGDQRFYKVELEQ